jgi:hypothetical protein
MDEFDDFWHGNVFTANQHLASQKNRKHTSCQSQRQATKRMET